MRLSRSQGGRIRHFRQVGGPPIVGMDLQPERRFTAARDYDPQA
jgi:hypothetical protein